MSLSKALVAILLLAAVIQPALTNAGDVENSAWLSEPQSGSRAIAEAASAEAVNLRRRRDFDSLRQAIAKYQEALAAWKSIGDRQEEANTLTSLGELHNLLGEKQRAVDHLQQALQMSQSLQDRRGEAAALNGLGAVYWSLSDTDNALDHYNKALTIRRELGDLAGEAQTLNNIALAWNWKGEYQKALENFSEALQVRRKLGDRTGEAQTLTNLGVLHKSLGENQKALEYFSQVLSLWQQAGDRIGAAYALSNLSEVHKATGEYQKALDQYQQALSLIRAVGDRRGEASTLNNIGAVYGQLGDYEGALNYLRQALEIRREISDRLGQAYTLNNLGQISAMNGDSPKALDFYNEALPLLRKTGDRFLEASVLHSLGQMHSLQAKKEKALENFDLALAIWRELRYEQGEAETLTAASQVYLASSKLPIALDYAIRSLQISRSARDRRAEAMALYTIARVYRELGNLNETRTYVEASLEIIESTRSALASLDLRASYRASNQSVYELYIDVLMHLNNREPGRGYDALAFAASERARARSLLETLTDANLNIREGVDAALLEQERSLRQRFSATASRAVRTAASTRNETQRGQAERDLESLLTEYQTIWAQIRSQSPRYAAIMQPRPSTLEEIQRQVLDDETLLLQYSLGKDRSYLWAVTTTGLKSYELPPRAEIESVARQLYSLLSAADKRELQTQVTLTAAQLSQLTLAPVVQQLGNKRLLIVADGALQYVPFAMLPRPSPAANDSHALSSANGRPLVLDHEVVSLPSSSVLAFLRQDRTQRAQPAKLVAILADPVLQTSDPRISQAALKRKALSEISAQLPENRPSNNALMRSVKESGTQFGRLHYTRREADAITALAGAGGSLMAVDFEASKATATSSALSQYRIIHFATHGLINSRHPELSGIVLSLVDEHGQPQDGFLRLHDIHNMKLNADMVVMSACQTALGKEVEGEGLIGLTRAFMYAGAARTVSSLWDVRDESTSELMKRFYEKMFKEGLKPSAALRAAQVSMLKEKRWESPHNWAAFILQGEWR